MFRRIHGQGPWLLASAVVLALIVSPFAIAAGTGNPLAGGKRNPSANKSQAYTSETEIIANNGTYGTRQSNKSANGGGAIYGCRSKVGGTEKGNKPCIRANNLSDGRAFEFESNGPEVGRITAKDAKAAPFTTNATGVATGLNADQVDGKNAEDIQKDAVTQIQGTLLFATVAANGTLGAQRGAAAAARTAEGSYNVAFANDISACAITATESQTDDAGPVGVQLGGDKKTVSVVTRTGGGADGTGATAVADRPFNLTVTC
jgi:hypothetical protein